MSETDNRSIYTLFYQRIIGTKTLLGQKLFSYKEREIEHIIEVIKLRGNSGPILDLGCSTGQFTRKLASQFGEARVHGADISERSVARCREKSPGIVYHHIADGFYRERGGQYQIVLLSHVLEHRDDPADMLTKVKDLLSEDGILFVCVPQERIRGDSALPENLYNLARLRFENVHRIKHSLETLTPLLSAAGLTISEHTYIHAFRNGRDEPSFANHSLVVCAELARA